ASSVPAWIGVAERRGSTPKAAVRARRPAWLGRTAHFPPSPGHLVAPQGVRPHTAPAPRFARSVTPPRDGTTQRRIRGGLPSCGGRTKRNRGSNRRTLIPGAGGGLAAARGVGEG